MAAQGVCKVPTSARMSQTGCSRRPDPFHLVPHPPRFLLNPWLGIPGLSLQARSNRTHVSELRPISAMVSASSSTEKPVKDSTPEWSQASIKAISVSDVEVRKWRYEEHRPETFLMGILLDATSVGSKLLRAHGITILKVRVENAVLNGKVDPRGKFPPASPPYSEAGQRVLDFAIAKKIKDGDGGQVTTPYLVLGIWSEVESVGHKIMAKLGFTEEKAKELESLCSIPE